MPSVGQVDLTISLDGRALGTQARAMGLLAGQQFRAGFNQAMNSYRNVLLRSLGNMGAEGGQEFGRSFRRGLNPHINAVNARLRRVFARIPTDNSGIDRLGDGFQRLSADIDRGDRSVANFHRRLSHGPRQFLFYTALFSALSSEIAILGSVAGSSLTIFATAAVAAGAAVGVFAIGVAGLLQDINEMPAAIRPVREAIDGLGAGFRGIADNVQIALWEGLAGAFSNLGTTLLPALNTGLTLTAQTLNGVVGELLEFAGSAEFIQGLNTAFQGIQPIIESLAGALGGLGSALGNIFLAALPFAQNFAAALEDIFQRFAEWTGSLEGQNALADWFSRAEEVWNAILPLLGSVGDLLNALVTPETTTMLVQLLETMTEFMPVLSEIGTAIANLNVFGLIADLLNAVGEAITPLLPGLQELASVIADVLSDAFAVLAPVIADILEAAAPLLPLLGEALIAAFQLLAPIVEALAPIITPLVEVLVILADIIVSTLAPVLGPLGELIAALLPATMPILEVFRALSPILLALAPVFELIGQIIGAVIATIVALFEGDFAQIGDIWSDVWDSMVAFYENTVKPLWDGLFQFITDILTNIGNFFTDTWNNITKGIDNFFRGLGRAWEAGWEAIGNFVRDVWNNIIGFIEGGVNGAIDLINGLIRGINNIGDAIGINLGYIPKVRLPRLATGGVAWGPSLVGEAGPELVIPLARPLDQVDPTVRALSAALQGISYPGASPALGSRADTIVEPGAIVVNEAGNGRVTAEAILDRLVARSA